MSALQKQEVMPPAPLTEGDKVLSMIDRVLSNPDLPIEKLEQMFDLYQKVQASEARKAFDAATAEAKAEIPVIKKKRLVEHETKAGGMKSYTHEDLGGIAEIIDPILAKHGLSYRYRVSSNVNEPISVTCIIAHRNGHFEETTLTAGRDDSGNKNAIQAIGSTITYLQRYSLKAALGLAAAKDDDGKKAGPEPEFITGEQAEELSRLITETKTDIAQFLDMGGIESLSDMPAKQFAAAKALLLKKKGGRA